MSNRFTLQDLKRRTREQLRRSTATSARTPRPTPIVDTPRPTPIVDTPRPTPIVSTPRPTPIVSTQQVPTTEFGDVPNNLEDLRHSIDDVRRQSNTPLEGGNRNSQLRRGDAFVEPPTGKRYIVQWDSYGCPFGEEGHQLNKALAKIAKQAELWPLDLKWNKMDSLAILDTWKILMSKFDLNANENACFYCFKIIHSRWRDWKCYIKKRCFEPYDNDEQRLEHRDPRVCVKKFENLLAQWNMPENKRLAEINKNNRAKRKMNHHTGSKSFAQIRQKMAKDKGASPSMLELLKEAYVPNDNDQNNILISQMNEFVITQQSQGSQETQEALEALAIESVLGPQKSDRVRGGGVGAATDRSRKPALGGVPLHIREQTLMQMKIDTLEHDNNYLRSCVQIMANRFGFQLPPPTTNPNIRSSESSAAGNP